MAPSVELSVEVKSMKEISKSIIHSTVMSDDGKYRFLLKRIWDKEKENATLVMLNPSKANLLKSDMTITNTMNFLMDKGFGSMSVVNLFPFMATTPKDLIGHKKDYKRENDKFIIEACENADSIFVGWVRGENKNRVKEVEVILRGYSNKVYCFQDNKGIKPRHPRNITDKWTVHKYF